MLADDLAAVVGNAHVLSDPEVVRGYCTDWTGRFSGPAGLVVRPGSTDQVAGVVRVCAASRVPIVVQGGNTGLVGGSVPPPAAVPGAGGSPSGPSGRSGSTASADGDLSRLPIVLSTTRLHQVGPVDVTANQVTAGAGATLAAVQAAAHAAGLTFAVDLAARDSSTIGGMVATNAGGLHVVRYGAMRQQVLGAEVVLADGTVLQRLGGLVKDNTGYDLSLLMVGSEGTLGIVTAVRLRLVARQPNRAVALLGLASTAEVVALASQLRRQAEGLQAVEVFYQEGLDLVCRSSGMDPPFAARCPAYLLVEVAGRGDVVEQLAAVLAEVDVDDGATAVADDDAGARRLWAYRERHTEAVSTLGVPHKLDVTLPVGELAAFETSVRQVVEAVTPGATLVLFGHVGDGNLHVNVVGPDSADEAVDGAVLELVAARGGSISAEHGIGRAKVRWLGLSRSTAELAAMGKIKAALDPDGILNPGVLLGDRGPVPRG